MNLGIINISMFSMRNVGRNRCRCTYPAVPNATLLCQVMVRIHLVAFLQKSHSASLLHQHANWRLRVEFDRLMKLVRV